jgi:RNA polymerase sigma factor (sigma-70 family)
MPVVPPSRIIRHLRTAALRQSGGALKDAQLLERFLAERDEAAFEALVRRYGPMVFGVCLRVLGKRHDAEDAFQATFLVLACKAATVRDRGAVGSWLYGVAYRTAGKTRARAARRRMKEREAAVPEARSDNHHYDDISRLLDLELSRLPEKYRGPVLLCDLEGTSRKDAALRLGLPEGTLSSRLATARSMLAKRLTRRGLALASGGVAAVLAQNAASACVPASLIGSTVLAAARVAAGHSVSAAASTSVATLAKGVMNTMLMSKLKVPLGLVLVLGFATLGWGVFQSTRAADESSPAKTKLATAAAPEDQATDDSTPAKTELAKAPAPDAQATDDDDDVDLPMGTPLTQVRVRLDKNGKLVVKTAIRGGSAPQMVPGRKGDEEDPPPPAVTTIQIQRYDLAGVKIVDAKGKKIDESELAKLIKKETIAMASLHGEPVDPRHLRVLKEGTLIFALPAARPTGNFNNPFGPPSSGAPGAAPPGGGRFAPTGGAPGPQPEAVPPQAR